MRKLLQKSVVALVGGAALLAGTIAANATETYTCSGQNEGLHFVIYEDGDTPTGGHLYINNIQVAVLNAWRLTNNLVSIRASVVGNTADTQFILNKSRQQVFIVLRDTESVVCDAIVREP